MRVCLVLVIDECSYCTEDHGVYCPSNVTNAQVRHGRRLQFHLHYYLCEH